VKRVAFRVQGRVQGVGYRWFALRAAERSGVAGFVRNDPDGSVSGEAEGDDVALAAFLADLRRGPRHGRVDAVTTAAVPANGGPGFTIR
jgi:acylphosphatase